MKVVSVETNIKSPTGKSQKYDLQDYNLLIGPNESGKSTAAEAVQLALTGAAYGLFFRAKSIKSGTHLADLTPQGAEAAFAEVQFDDGSTSRWEVSIGSRAKHTGVKGVALPVAELHSAITGTAGTARKFFLQRLLTEVSRADLMANLVESVGPAAQIVEDMLPSMENIPVDMLIELMTNIGKRKRESKSAQFPDMGSLQCGEPRDAEALRTLVSEMACALQFEFIKKHYSEFQGAEKQVISKLCGKIGAPAEIARLSGSAQYWDSIEAMLELNAIFAVASELKQAKDMATTRAADYGAIEKALDKYIFKLLEEPLGSAYVARVNSFLAEDDFEVFHTLESFRVGLVRDGHKHTALSGSTEARVLAAMAAALAMPNQPAVVVVDDRMWDSATLAKTMQALEKAPCQVILMSTIKPRGRNRSKWNYIDIKKVEADDAPKVEEVVVEAAPAEIPENGATDVFAQLLQ